MHVFAKEVFCVWVCVWGGCLCEKFYHKKKLAFLVKFDAIMNSVTHFYSKTMCTFINVTIIFQNVTPVENFRVDTDFKTSKVQCSKF